MKETIASVEFKIGDLVLQHYCGGTFRGQVTKVNAKSCVVQGEGRKTTIAKNKLKLV